MASDNNKILVSFLAGAATGLALGILLAPDKGANTRSKIKSKVLDLESEVANAVGGKVNDLKGKFHALINSKEQG